MFNIRTRRIQRVRLVQVGRFVFAFGVIGMPPVTSRHATRLAVDGLTLRMPEYLA